MGVWKLGESFINQRGSDVARGVVDARFLGGLVLPFPRETLIDLTQQADRDVGEIIRPPIPFFRPKPQQNLPPGIPRRFFAFEDRTQMNENTPASPLPNSLKVAGAAVVCEREQVAVEGLIEP